MSDREKRLQAIRERHEASTPGEWGHIADPLAWKNNRLLLCQTVEGSIDPDDEWLIGEVTFGGRLGDDTYNADFIAHAHQDIPFLLAEIERLESIIGKPMMDQILGRASTGGKLDVS